MLIALVKATKIYLASWRLSIRSVERELCSDSHRHSTRTKDQKIYKKSKPSTMTRLKLLAILMEQVDVQVG